MIKKWIYFLVIASYLTSCNQTSIHEKKKKPISLRIIETEIMVDNRLATVYSLKQPDGTLGLSAKKGEEFDVELENTLQVPTSIHWHGLILPNNQDGVAYITQYPLYPNEHYHYHFPLVQSGTFWMHSHFNLQEQRLLSAPLILEGPDDCELADQEAVMFLTDFSFRSPEEIFEQLKKGMSKVSSPMRADLVEVDYDAFLANSKTLEAPEIITVHPDKKVRLRIINGSSATNFFLSLGNLQGEAIAVDGNRIESLFASNFELAIAQRIDLIVTIPENGGAFPIFAQGEGTNKQTGIILATKDAPLPPLSKIALTTAGALTNENEAKFRALHPLSVKQVDRNMMLELGGDMMNYIWTINGQAWPNVTPLIVNQGERVEIIFKNVSTMSHPMHLHGHTFQVVALNDKPIPGAMRDTILVLPNSTVTIQFDANNIGIWPLHCHVLYHLEAGMLNVVRYNNFIQPL